MRPLLGKLSRSWFVLPLLVLALGAGVGLLVTEVVRDDDSPPSSPAGSTVQRVVTARPTRDPAQRSFLANVIPAPAGSISGQAPPRAIARLVRTMPLERKIAQLMLVGFSGQSVPAASLKRYDWGGLMLGSDNYAGRAQLLVLTAGIKDAAARAKHVQPLLMAVQQGGDFSAFPDLPPADAPADIGSVDDAAASAKETGRALRAVGLDGLFAPSLEVGPPDGVMGARAFSEEPDDVASYASATVPAYAASGVLAAAGRFPGLGSAQQAPEDGPANVGLSLDELAQRDLMPFQAAIKAGVPAIVVGSGLYTTDDFVVPASSSRKLVSALLRGQLGFRGLVLSDDLTEPAVTAIGDTPSAAVDAIGAGVDMVYVSGDDAAVTNAYTALLGAAKGGKLRPERIDDALTHVLVAKASVGLLKPRKVAKKNPAPVPPAP